MRKQLTGLLPNVTPYVGVWIETIIMLTVAFIVYVTPYVGVWIETNKKRLPRPRKRSHPTWVCGLKLIVAHVMGNFTVSHPTWVCGLKQKAHTTIL